MSLSLEAKALVLAVVIPGLSLGGAGLTALALQRAEPASPAAPEPISLSPELAPQGARYFALSCSHCHADDATGDEGPSLHQLTISNARIAATIKKGIKGEMPSFAKKYDDRQVAALASYLRSLP